MQQTSKSQDRIQAKKREMVTVGKNLMLKGGQGVCRIPWYFVRNNISDYSIFQERGRGKERESKIMCLPLKRKGKRKLGT